jgi:hypothetical protein
MKKSGGALKGVQRQYTAICLAAEREFSIELARVSSSDPRRGFQFSACLAAGLVIA